MPTMKTADFFNNNEFSDLTVIFSGREIMCHKFILCRYSDYFKKLCGPGSSFSESKETVIELEDDNADALEAALRYIYTDAYRDQDSHLDKSWQFHLEVSVTARKYLLESLSNSAFQRFKGLVWDLNDAAEVFDAMQTLPTYEDHSDYVAKLPVDLREAHIQKLLQLPAFRKQLEEDRELMWKYLDHFSSSYFPIAFASELVEKKIVRCSECSREVLRDPDFKSPSSKCPLGNCSYYRDVVAVTEKCWVKKGSKM